MSSTTGQQTTLTCPWKRRFEADISAMGSPEFVLSTVAPAPASSRFPALPHARFCIYRGMWAELPDNRHNDLPRNPAAYASALPTFTTDVRMAKVADLFASGPGRATDRAQTKGSGGGGPVEAVWWAKDPMVQWRLRGQAWVVAADVDGETHGQAGSTEGSGVRSLKSEVGRRMEVLDAEGAAAWSWGKELKGHFGNVSPGMRGSWKTPPPGTKADYEPDEQHKLGQKVGADDELAWSNFRVVIIKPDEVESLHLSNPETGRRHLYKFVEENGLGKWTEEVLWP